MTRDQVYCHCGLPLHYTDPEVQRIVQHLIDVNGPLLPVTARGHTWLVQRHYIALHGIRAADLADLGFDEVTA